MGNFSWRTCDTDNAILHVYNKVWAKPTPAYVLIPSEFGGGYLEELDYEGYGVFDGVDVYALFARWNKPKECNGDVDHDRSIGIRLCFSDEAYKYPIKIASKPAIYEDMPASKTAINQGFWPDDDKNAWMDDDDEDWE